ncbi:signal peptidase I [Coraliomargarita sp. SDUM461004]|uniref:Signal peptidase I n=1 Tax=Thalassobacterium sedimentorum TaxID=3041258 RepID=A0ABU1ANR2_9BACT|nr:signal peptidase I [Coraliomargarita sp. SDUM461004]MDQ8196421.1 signal peptidase I [Coraliomargarita sp. SDUM461004]
MNKEQPATKRRRWPGIVLSLFVPGFGLARAGMPKRAVLWFFGLPIASLATGIILALKEIPFPIAIVAFAASIILYIAMLCDSFRAGKMKKQLWFLYFGIFILLFLLPTPVSMVLRTFTIPTGSMAPTLMGADSTSGSDYVIANRLSYCFSPPQRGDLIVFATSDISGLKEFQTNDQGEVFYVMRLIGLPGETISIAENKVFADGVQLSEEDGIPTTISYVTASEISSLGAKKESNFQVGLNEYFVLGDNSRNSLDSRFWGGVPESSVFGKVTTIYYPFNRAGRISPHKEKQPSNQTGDDNSE